MNQRRYYNTVWMRCKRWRAKLKKLEEGGRNLRKQGILRHRLQMARYLLQRLHKAIRMAPAGAALTGFLMIVPSYTTYAQVFELQQGSANPLNGVDLGYFTGPAFVNLDGDGDFDAFIGEETGFIFHYRNTGTPSAPVLTLQTGSNNPFNGMDVGFNSMITFVDIDGDGDTDAFAGNRLGTFTFFRNVGTAVTPVFSIQTGSNNPLNGVSVGQYSAPAFADVDHDGDQDMFSGEMTGTIVYYKNTGTAYSPFFSLKTGPANPFNAVDAGDFSAPVFVDIDGDDDMDAFIGEMSGGVIYYKNTGTASAPVFVFQQGSMNPLNGITVAGYSTPFFADIDNDGDKDLFIGEMYGTISFYRNLQPPCNNPLSGGEIAAAQAVCAGSAPEPFTSISPASGQTGNPEYKWQFSTNGPTGSYSDIGSSNSPVYAPGALMTDTWYRRLSRAECRNSWSGATGSNILEVSVEPLLMPGVSAEASANPAEAGTFVTFTATPVNGGTTPFYQWYVNGLAEGSNSNVFSYIPLNGDRVSCSMTSDVACPLSNPVVSGFITMTVYAVPMNVLLQNILVSGTECHNAIQSIDVAGTGTTFSVEAGASETMIAGRRISLHPGTTVAAGGILSARIRPQGPWCFNDPGRAFSAAGADVQQVRDALPFRVYPNPTDGKIFLVNTGGYSDESTHVEIFKMTGERIHQFTVSGSSGYIFSLEGHPAGIYMLNIRSNQRQATLKLIRQ